MSWDRNYSTKNQGMAAAFAVSSVGDEVVEHFEGCESDDNCTCQSILWRLTENGWTAAPLRL